MAASPSYIVRRAHGAEAGALYDLPDQGFVCLHLEDIDLARLLQEQGVVPPRPPYLDAVHGGHAPRPQINWFLDPPVEGAAAALSEVFRESDAGYEIAPAVEAPAAGPFPAART